MQKEEKRKIFSRKTKLIVFGALTFIFLLVALIITSLEAQYCDSYSCFQEAMFKCKPAIYINDEVEASWKYTIIGQQGKNCVISVKLLQAKEGEMGVEKLAGYSMDCYYEKGVVTYPEKNLEKCHGRLKEEFQSIVIKKMHSYMLKNLGQINQSLQNPFNK